MSIKFSAAAGAAIICIAAGGCESYSQDRRHSILSVVENGEEQERLVCRTMPSSVGTRLSDRRVCLTAAEWQSMREDDAQELRRSRGFRDAVPGEAMPGSSGGG
jgi:hypothetical protein